MGSKEKLYFKNIENIEKYNAIIMPQLISIKIFLYK